MYVFGTDNTSFQDIKDIQRILSQFRCFSEKIISFLKDAPIELLHSAFV